MTPFASVLLACHLEQLLDWHLLLRHLSFNSSSYLESGTGNIYKKEDNGLSNNIDMSKSEHKVHITHLCVSRISYQNDIYHVYIQFQETSTNALLCTQEFCTQDLSCNNKEDYRYKFSTPTSSTELLKLLKCVILLSYLAQIRTLNVPF